MDISLHIVYCYHQYTTSTIIVHTYSLHYIYYSEVYYTTEVSSSAVSCSKKNTTILICTCACCASYLRVTLHNSLRLVQLCSDKLLYNIRCKLAYVQVLFDIVYTHVHTCTHLYINTHTCAHMYTRTYTHMYTHTYTHTYTRIHTHTYTHT